MATTYKIAGYGGTATIGGTDCQVGKWSAKLTKEKIDTSNSASGVWKESIPGMRVLEGSFEAVGDSQIYAAGFPFASTDDSPVAFSLKWGKTGLILDFSGNVFGVNYDSDTGGPAAISGDFESTGAVTYS